MSETTPDTTPVVDQEVLNLLVSEYENLKGQYTPKMTPGRRAGLTKRINDLSDGIHIVDPSLTSNDYPHLTSDKSKSSDLDPSTQRALNIARSLIRKSES